MISVSGDLEQDYRSTVKLSWALVADLALLWIAVEVIRIWLKPFDGFVRSLDFDWIRPVFLFIGFIQYFLIKWAANIPLKGIRIENIKHGISRLQLSAMIVYAMCELVAIMGFVLYLMKGLRHDFYIFLVLSAFYLTVYFPKKKEWKNWMKTITEDRNADSLF